MCSLTETAWLSLRCSSRVPLPVFENTMPQLQPNNLLHGATLERILTDLVERVGWSRLGQRVNIRCFNHEPSIASSLKFLRRTPWARSQVEALYIETVYRGMDASDPRQAPLDPADR